MTLRTVTNGRLIDGAKLDNITVTQPVNLDSIEISAATIATHIANLSNPHAVTKSQVGLSNVDNTSDLSKPISTATQTALDAKQNTLIAGTNIIIVGDTISASGGPGLGTVTSVSSANSDISVANGTSTPILTLNSGTTANKIVKLDGSGKLPAVDGSQLTNLPSSGGDVVGPSSSTDNAIARFDTTTGKLIQDSAATIADTTGDITAGKYNTVAISGSSTPTLAVTGTTAVSGTNTGDQDLSGLAVKASSLSQFASTTSAELASVISDETGSGGVLVFSNSPALTTPSISAINVSGGTLTLPTGASDTLVRRNGTDTLTNKTIALGSNTVSGTIAQFNAACTDADFATGGGTATGTNTGDQTNISGNAGTSTTLQTARTINGVSFNGSANITVPSDIAPGTSGNVLTSNGTVWTSAAPSGGGGSAQVEPLQDYQGTATIGVLGTFVFDSAKTITKMSLTADTIPVGSNLIIELRKNSYTSGNILPSTLQIATSDTLTNGKKTVSVSLTTSNTMAAGDYVTAYITSAGSTTPALNPFSSITFS